MNRSVSIILGGLVLLGAMSLKAPWWQQTLASLATTVYDTATSVPLAVGPRLLEVTSKIPTPPPAVPAVGKAIVADLQAMTISLAQDGTVLETFPIVSKGRPGTAWETPAGEYSIKTRELNHFSSIGAVWMPYSMQFFGNYFIHGWPYYSNGVPVGRGYSGGCIRLATDDAARVFEFGETGTTVLVVNDAYGDVDAGGSERRGFFRLDPGRVLTLSAESYLIADLDTGTVITAKDAAGSHPIASVTKLMTALISLDTLNQYLEATVSPRAAATYDTGDGLTAGATTTIGDLLYPLLLESSNDAAEVLAERLGRDYFLKQMNSRAAAIGLTATHFTDPSGIEASNVSTAEDLYRLTRYLYANKAFLFDVLRQPTATTTLRVWHNNSHLLGNPTYVGGKSGETRAAKQSLVAVFSLPVGPTAHPIAVMLLRSDNRDADAAAVLAYLDGNLFFGTRSEALAASRLAHE